MPRIHINSNIDSRGVYSGATIQKLMVLTVATWHAAFAGGGGAIDVAAGFTNPGVVACDRIPEILASAGAVPGLYTITGTWNSAPQVATILTIAGVTVKADRPFDTITRFQGPDPGAGQSVTLNQGDAWADPPIRCLWTGDGGDIYCQLADETAINAVTITLPAQGEWVRRIIRVDCTNSTITNAWFCW